MILNIKTRFAQIDLIICKCIRPQAHIPLLIRENLIQIVQLNFKNDKIWEKILTFAMSSGRKQKTSPLSQPTKNTHLAAKEFLGLARIRIRISKIF